MMIFIVGMQKGELMKLIDADVALEALIEKGQASRRYKLGEIWELNCQEIREALNTVPSAQKKGHWIDEGTNYCCSECHRGCWVNSDYCPWCGADMREGKRIIKNCRMRHENGNCLPAGGFCTSNKNICEALHNAYELGRTSA